jgi:RNA polymerase sigma factor (sigma-70 family)
MRPVSSPAPQPSAKGTSQPTAPAGADRAPARPSSDRVAARSPSDEWAQRAGRLYTDLERPARAMVRRAFRGAFSDDELDDIYSSAWVGTLRALGRRHAELSDEEVGKYLLTAVANQASKELRRRRRKPTARLESVPAIADDGGPPDERAVGAERSRVVRDLLASLPARRRAVMLLRYGWGLEPRQVCDLVEGLSPRAYRKEVTRGIDELTERMRRLEAGEWCADREPVLKAYATGFADADQRRQARAHLAHCHQCSDFVARLSGHLHDLGAGLAAPGAVEALGGETSLGDRLGDLGDRVREAVGGLLARGGGESVQEAAGHALAAGGTRGTGTVAGAGLLAKLTGVGTAGKVAIACLTGGAAATACVSAGVVPGVGLSAGGADRERSAPREPGGEPPPVPVDRTLPDPAAASPAPSLGQDPSPSPVAPVPEQQPAPPPPSEPVEAVAPTTPPEAQEFGVPAAASSSGGGSSGSGDLADSGGGSGGGGSAVRREFGGP